MGSLRFASVLFCVYSRDHPPPHVHAIYGEIKTVLDLVVGGGVRISGRSEPVKPRNAKLSDIRRIVRIARAHEAELRRVMEADTWNRR